MVESEDTSIREPFNALTLQRFNENHPALARNTRRQQSDTGATFHHALSALSAWEVSVCEKFWRSPSAPRNRQLARYRAGQDQKAKASRQSSDQYRGLA